MKTQGRSLITHFKELGEKARGLKKECLERVFSFRKCTKVSETDKYLESHKNLCASHDGIIDANSPHRSVTSKNNQEQEKTTFGLSRLNSDESGVSSFDESLEFDLSDAPAERHSQVEMGCDYIDVDVDEPLAHSPIAKLDEGFDDLEGAGHQHSAQVEIIAHLNKSQRLTEKMSSQDKSLLQETLTKMMCFYAGLSFKTENVQRFNDVRPFELESGQIRSDFVLKLMTDEESFGRFCNMGKLVRDVFPLLDEQHDLMKAVLGDDGFYSLREEARRDAVYPFIIDGFWKLTLGVWLKSKSPDLLKKLENQDRVFSIEAMVALSGFSGDLATLERKLLNYDIKGVLSIEDIEDAGKCHDHASSLRELSGRLYDQWYRQPVKALKALDVNLKEGQMPPFSSQQVGDIERKFLLLIEKQPEYREKRINSDKEQLRKEPLRDYKKLLTNAVLAVKNRKREIGADGVERHTLYEKLKQECSHENLRAFYNELRQAIIRSIDENELAKIREEQLVFLDAMIISGLEPALGKIPIDGLALINDTTFEWSWKMIEPDLPRESIIENKRQSFRFKSRKHKIEKENLKLKSRAKAEFNISSIGSIGVDIAYQQATGNKIVVK